MSEGLNDLESALRRLQPAGPATGPMLFAMGRAAALRSVRIWRSAALLGVFSTISLGGLLLFRPEPEVRVVVVPVVVPAFSAATPKSEPAELVAPMTSSEPAIPEWRLERHHVRLEQEPLSEPGDAVSPVPSQEPLGVGDLFKGPLVWSTISMGGH